MTGFLRRATRYVTSPGRDPREDRLTQVSAAVLERVPGLARELMLGWLDPRTAPTTETSTPTTEALWRRVDSLPAETPALASTQRFLPPNRRVDLELRLPAPDGGLAATVWVEVKHGTDPSRGQVPGYLSSCPDNTRVVLLSTRERLPILDLSECPESVPQRTWQETANRARRFARRVDDPVARWLLDEWLIYLREEGLMDPVSLGPEHMTALMYGAEAEQALSVLCQEAMAAADATVVAPFEQSGGDKPKYGLGYWAKWGLGTTDEERARWDNAWFDWKVVRSRGRGHGIPTGHVFVMAGLSKARGEFTSPDPSWIDSLLGGIGGPSGPLVFLRWRGDHERLQRVGYLHQVVRGDTLADQGRELGRWVTETFDALQRHGPPQA